MSRSRNNRLRLWTVLSCFFAAVAVIVCDFASFSDDETVQRLIELTLTRAVCIAPIILFSLYFGLFSHSSEALNVKKLLLCIPFLLVAVNNFPYSAYLGGQLELNATAPQIVWFSLSCLFVGLFEELLFRGVLTVFLLKKMLVDRRTLYFALLLGSAIFALSHLLNLFGGASVGVVLLQVGYSFLIGCMLSVCLVVTKNMWLCAFFHAVFNFFGNSLDYFAVGNSLDVFTVVLTAVIGIFTLIWCIVLLNKTDIERLKTDLKADSLQK